MAKTYADYLNDAFRGKDYLKAQQEANDLASQAPDFLAKKQAELASADPALQALTTERGRLRSQLYSAPATGQQDYRDIFDPIKRQALISQAIGNTTGLLSGAEARIQQRQGSVDQLANRAYDMFKTNLDQKQGVAKSLLDYGTKIAEKGYEESQRQVKRQEDLTDYEKKLRLKESVSPSKSGTDPLKGLQNAKWNALNKLGITRKQSSDGGWTFYANGQPVSAEQITQAVPGVSMKDILADSKNPQDKKYVSSLSLLEELLGGGTGVGVTNEDADPLGLGIN